MTLQSEFMWPFLKHQNRKVTMEVKNKQQAVIEFLLLEWCAGHKTVRRLRNVCDSAAYCCASVFRRIGEVRSGNEELRNERHSGRFYRCETDAAIRSISQRRPECLAENYRRNYVDFVRAGSHAYVADRLHFEQFTLDSPYTDL
jgi:hypothetical protein